jgi:beta-glucanase (GH16 family)
MPRRDQNAALSSVAALVAISLACPARASFAGEALIHAEDFSSAAKLDASFWIAETGFFRNKEAQYYQPANVSVEGGALVLEGRRETVSNAAYDANGGDWLTTTRSAEFTSGSIVSREAFTYGVFEVVARLPQGAGAWPAVWTVFEQGLPYREIDLVEAVGAAPGRVWSTREFENMASRDANTRHRQGLSRLQARMAQGCDRSFDRRAAGAADESGRGS